MTPKQEAQTTHKIAALAFLLTEALDEINATSKPALDLKQKASELLPFCEHILGEGYQVNQIYKTTYLTDLSNKVNTVIRKN